MWDDGWFAAFGGQYVAPPLVPVLRQLEKAARDAFADPTFTNELAALLRDFVGRPTPLAPVLAFGRERGVRVFLKREDLAASGSTHINAAVGQCLLARRMGAKRVIADTGSGHHGIATAAVATRMGLACSIYMSRADASAQPIMVDRMRRLGADVHLVDLARATVSEAVSAAFQAWTGSENDFYVAGGPLGPHPYPALVSRFQSITGEETFGQIAALGDARPAALVAMLGGGSTALGLFGAFIPDDGVRLIVAEGAGARMRLRDGRPGVLHGARTIVLQDEDGQVIGAPGGAGGLGYPAVAPEIAALWQSGRLESLAIGDEEAAVAQERLARHDGILVSFEAGHALAAAAHIAGQVPPGGILIVAINAGDNAADTLAIAC